MTDEPKPNAFNTFYLACDGLEKCTVPITDDIFGQFEPCDTRKFVWLTHR